MTEDSKILFPADKQVALCVNVMFEKWATGTWPLAGPMGNPLGSGVTDYQALSWSQYGAKTGIWRIREVLENADVLATCFVSGMLALEAPEILLGLKADGHDIVAHGWSQDQLPPVLSDEEERESIFRCRDALGDLLGKEPRGWISPRCTPSVRTPELLAEAGFEWWGDVFDADNPYRLETVRGSLIAFPFQMELNDLPHRVRYGGSYATLFALWQEELLAARESGEPRWIDLTLHAHISGRPSGITFLRKVLGEARASQDVWIATRSQVLAAYMKRSGADFDRR